jgi:hypothetical protein
MPDARPPARAFSIERRRQALVETGGRTSETSEVFVKVYRGLVTSGLLAELSGNELKVLLVLGLEARVLGGDAGAEHDFERLKALGVVAGTDRGRLFCCLDRETIAERAGLGVRTVSTVGQALVDRQLVEKRSVRNHSGRQGHNLYFIQPASHLGKFEFNRRPAPRARERACDREQDLPLASTECKQPPVVACTPIKKKNRSRGRWKEDPTTGDFASAAPGPSPTTVPPDASGELSAAPGPSPTNVPPDASGELSAAPGPPPTATPPDASGERSAADAEVFARFAGHQVAVPYRPTERERSALAGARTRGYSQAQILAAVDRAFDDHGAVAEPIRSFAFCLPLLQTGGPSARQPQPVPTGSPAVTPPAESHVQQQVQPVPVPSGPSPAAPGPLEDGGTPGEGAGDGEWEAALERAFRQVRRAGWPLDETRQAALRAKAVRVDPVARRQQADGPGWVADAMLLALGRKIGKKGRQAPTDEQLLAYVDGILRRWTQQGRSPPPGRNPPRRSATGSPAPAREASPSPGRTETGIGGHLPPRRAQSAEEALWEGVLADLKLQMDRATFDHLLRGSQVRELRQPAGDAAHLVVEVVSPLALPWLERRLEPLVRRAVVRRLGGEATLTFQAPDQAGSTRRPVPAPPGCA